MAYGIGLDIGIGSVGYAVVALDYDEEPWGIESLGSRIFDVAENSDGSSLAKPRRDARSMRRRLRRRRHRMERIRNLILSNKILDNEQLDHLYDGQLSDIYALRTKALDKLVNAQELARIMIHLAQRRGFKSNRKTDASNKEEGQLLQAVTDNAKRMQVNGYRTVGEMFLKDETFKDIKRNKGGQYLTTVQRDLIKDEAEKIFSAQQKLKNKLVNNKLKDNYLEILLSQRPFDLGPGAPSPYGGDQISKMVGKCTFEKDEQRAAKACYSFEYFNLLQKVNHLRLLVNGEAVFLDANQRKKIIDLAHSKADLKYSTIRKELGLGEKILFGGLDYSEDRETVEKKAKFNFLPAYHQIRKALDKVAKNHIAELSKEQLNSIGTALTLYKTDTKITEYLKEAGIQQQDIDALLTINGFSKFGHLSVKACDKIIPFLEKGLVYNEACEKAGYDFKAHSSDNRSLYLLAKIDEMDDITSPVARRAIAQTIKVINAIIKQQGDISPTFINIELSREMARNFDDRKKMQKSMDDNQSRNARLMERIKTEFHKSHPTGLDLVKLKLFEDQGGICMYSQKIIKVENLFDDGYVEVDHIVPYSISFDDTYNNKVLVFAKENRNKGNMLPLQYMKGKQKDNFKVWVNNNVKNYRKRQRLLKEKITEDDINKFKERNLQDTKTMSRFLYNYINDYLKFTPFQNGRKKHVTAINGSITAYMRKRWGINKNRANGDRHHAVDAVVIACTTDKMIHDISKYSESRELEFTRTEEGSLLVNRATGEIIKRFPYPWPEFRNEVLARAADNPAIVLEKLNLDFYKTKDINTIKPIFVSRMPRRKVTGAAHKDTFKGIKKGVVTLKTALTNLKLDKKTGEIENYYNPESDKLLYAALKEQLYKFNGDAKKAFAEPFYKPKADGTQGPLVRKVKVFEKSTLNVPVLQGKAVAGNDSMVRVDVFKVEGDGYYLVPIYIVDTLKDKLPNKAIVQGKSYDQWKEMKNEDFIFSLYPNDLIKVQPKQGINFTIINKDSDLPEKYSAKEAMVYYKKAGIATGTITVITNDNTYIIKSLGVKSLLNIEKYQVDVLGNYNKVKHEIRQTFQFKDR